MTDFFATLVERVVPSAPRVVPRRAARFESLASELPPVEVLESSQPLAPSAAAHRPTEPAAPPREMPHAAPTLAPPAPIARAREHPADAPIQRRETIAPPLPSSVPERMVDAPRAIRTGIDVPAPRATPAITPRAPDDARVERRASPTERSRETMPREALRERPAAVARPPAQPTIIVPSVGRRAPDPERSADEAVERRGAEPTPALPPRIEVTIGVVEVRALVVPPAPPPVPRAPREVTPPVSLGDYLAQRGKARA